MSTVHDTAFPVPFENAEYAARQQRVRDAAHAQGFDAPLIADPANLYYLTGYNAWSFYMPQVLHLPVEGDPTFILREMDANGAHRTATGIAPEHIFGYPETLIHQHDSYPGQWIAQKLRDRGHGDEDARVGYEGEAHFFTVRTFRALQEPLPHWNLAECHDLVNWVRLVKSPAEIEYMRAAGRVCDFAIAKGVDALYAGRPANEVAAEIMHAQAYGPPASGTHGATDGDYPAIVPMLPTGAGADTPHLTWSKTPMPENEGISFEIAGVHRRYHAPMARTAVIGTPAKELARLAQVTVEGIQAALTVVKPDATAHHVTDAFTRVISTAGYTKNSRLGYSIGIGFPPDWGERTVSLRRDDHTVLQENMTFHLIGGMWMTGYGFESSDAIRVTSSGVERLTSFPRDLIVVPNRRHV